MAAKAHTLGGDLRQATQYVMGGKKDLPDMKVCTCTQYQPFSAILLIFHTKSAGVTCNLI